MSTPRAASWATASNMRERRIVSSLRWSVVFILCFIFPAESVLPRMKDCVWPEWDCGITASMFARSPTSLSVRYYLSANGGSDENDGLTPETPWQTLDRALEVLSDHPTERVEFRLGAGQYGGLDITRQTFEERSDPNAWVMFMADHLACFAYVNIEDVGDAKVVLSGLIMNDLGHLPDGRSAGVFRQHGKIIIRNSGQVRIANCFLDPRMSAVEKADEAGLAKEPRTGNNPTGILFTTGAYDVIIQESTIVGGRVGVVFEMGRDLHLWDSEVGHQWQGKSAVLVESSSDVSIKNNIIHDLHSEVEDLWQKRPTQPGERRRRRLDPLTKDVALDGVRVVCLKRGGEFFDVEDENVLEQPTKIVITGNTFRHVDGTSIKIVGPVADETKEGATEYIEDVTIARNLIEPPSSEDENRSPRVDITGVKRFSLVENTVVDGRVKIATSKAGAIRGNLIYNLVVGKNTTIGDDSDFNVVEHITVEESSTAPLGANSVHVATTFANPEGLVFDPTTIEACTGGENGTHVGAVLCNPCEWDSMSDEGEDMRPVALFAVHPKTVSAGEQFGLYAGASTACGDEDDLDYVDVQKLVFNIKCKDYETNIVARSEVSAEGGDEIDAGEAFDEDQIRVIPPVFTSIPESGICMVKLVITDTNGVKSKPVTRQITVAEPDQRR